MSGLVAAWFKAQSADPGTVDRMLAASPHRGTCVRALSHGQTVLAASEVDGYGEASTARCGPIAVAICGVLDNAADIRQATSRAGHRPNGPTDAAIVAAAWAAWGDDAATRLRGTYSVAVSDGEQLFCFRDHIGYRGLFHHEGEEATYVASEIKQVAAGANLPMTPNLEVVGQIFYGDYDDDTPTAVQGVRRLPKAAVLTCGATGTTVKRYWRPERLIETARLSQDEIQEGFDHAMDQAVRRCLGQEPSVISLSGGIDSPVVASYAAPAHHELTGRPLPALSIVAPRYPSVDESHYIRDVVAYLGIAPWHTYEQRVRSVEGLGRWVALCDGPPGTITMNELEEHYLQARSHGYRNIITGEFAEFVVDRPEGLLVHLMVHGRLRALSDRIALERAHGRPRHRILRELTGVVVPQRVIAQRQRRHDRMGWVRPEWLDEDRVAASWQRVATAPRSRWRERQTSFLRGPGLSLEAAEIVQAHVGVRVRRPWLDVDLAEFLLSLPAEIKYAERLRKPLARSLARGRVPDRILDRRDKTVFNESMQARLDYDELKRWLLVTDIELPGVDYGLLRQRLEEQEMSLSEYRWARDLAAAHAFLETCGA